MRTQDPWIIWYRSRPKRPPASGYKLFCRHIRGGGSGQPGTSCNETINTWIESANAWIAQQKKTVAQSSVPRAAAHGAAQEDADADMSDFVVSSMRAAAERSSHADANSAGEQWAQRGATPAAPARTSRAPRDKADSAGESRQDIAGGGGTSPSKDPRERPDLLWKDMSPGEREYYEQQACVLRMVYQVFSRVCKQEGERGENGHGWSLRQRLRQRGRQRQRQR